MLDLLDMTPGMLDLLDTTPGMLDLLDMTPGMSFVTLTQSSRLFTS